MADDPLRTPLHDWHAAHGGRMVEFGGWSMPVQYSTIVEEHRAVRERVGLFDISHMGRLTFQGPEALPWLETVTTNHVARLAEGQVQYSLMANEAGGLIDDVLVYRLPFSYAMVCNASNRAAVLAQLEGHQPQAGAEMADRTTATAMIAVQGPRAIETLQPLFGSPLGPIPYYHATQGRLLGAIDAVVSRTGYTGEDGFELMVAAARGVEVWDALLDAGRPFGIAPCGLGARDTLRFEAGMPLFGHEMDETVNPYAAGLGWAVKLGKGEFVGRDALRRFQADPGRTRVGLELAGKRPARQGCPVLRDGQAVGTVTSGTSSPTLGKSLAMALVEPAVGAVGTALTVDVRGHDEPAEVVPLPFYRRPHPSTTTPSS
ncbi:MAG TPA: glycine cleavage system aminomethyltransferase GcvT [Isosphaeraceae bacterium]|jgi:aminomethyltransferase|nr:glycine cleavage system aminomethyltransferase GcvT [Isosphaeraceae bacterium]